MVEYVCLCVWALDYPCCGDQSVYNILLRIYDERLHLPNRVIRFPYIRPLLGNWPTDYCWSTKIEPIYILRSYILVSWILLILWHKVPTKRSTFGTLWGWVDDMMIKIISGTLCGEITCYVIVIHYIDPSKNNLTSKHALYLLWEILALVV